MLTLAVAFLFLAMIAALGGYLGAGTLAFAAAAIFFAAFLWALVVHKRKHHPHSD